MPRLLWSILVLGAFGAGWATAWLRHQAMRPLPAAQLPVVTDWQQQIAVLQQHIRAQDVELEALRQRVQAPQEPQPVAESVKPDRMRTKRPFVLPGSGATVPAEKSAAASVALEAPPTEETGEPPVATTAEVVRSRLQQYLAETEGLNLEQRRQRLKTLGDELRAMGEPALVTLLQELDVEGSSRERRTAAALLGALQDVRALPALQDVLEREQDLLLRRSAAYGLRLMQLPETIPVLSKLLANPQDDRFVRMSAAYGLALLGDGQGVTGLVQLFDEADQDGEGRRQAFRSLLSLNDFAVLPFMRQLVVADADVSYRMAAMRFLAEHGDQQALPLLKRVVDSPHEQPSIVDAAAKVHAAIASGHVPASFQEERTRRRE